MYATVHTVECHLHAYAICRFRVQLPDNRHRSRHLHLGQQNR